jgi:hypothetical protein
MKHSILKLSALAFVLVFAISGCKKKDKDDEIKDYDYQAMQDNATSEGIWDDMSAMSDQASDGSGSLSSYRPSDANSVMSTCAQITYSPGSPNVITVNFPNFCLCSDGRYRKGQFTITYNGMYRDSGTVITISALSSDNYYVSYPSSASDSTKSIKVTGTKTVTNRGHNTSGHLWYTIHVDAVLYKYTGETMTWTSDRQREWISGESTPNWLDDQYSIKGSANGVSFSSVAYTIQIDDNNPLFVDFNCFTSQPYSCKITKGIFTLTPSGKVPRVLDFGSGACDNEAVATVNGQSFSVFVR